MQMSGTRLLDHATEYSDMLAPGLGGCTIQLTGREPEVSGLRHLVTPPLVVHVDDEPFMRKFAAMVLALYGYHYRGFSDGDIALSFCRSTPPHLVITDVMHPGVWGPELCREVYDSSRGASRLMVLTACAPSASMLLQTDDIPVEWMFKPFQMPDLLAAVDRLIGPGVPRPPSAPTLAETLRLIDWDSDDVFPPFLPQHTHLCHS
jgi:CheY-like chemotaxis protein